MTRTVCAVLSVCAALAACDGPAVEGDRHALIAVASADRWSEMEDDVRAAVERQVSGVTDERVFTVVHQEPYGEGWETRSLAPLLLVIGTTEDPWVQEALDAMESPRGDPGLQRAVGVWAEGQVANILILPASGEDEEMDEHLAALYAQLHADFRAMVRAAMYAEGANSELADTLWENEGFGILVPDTYAYSRSDSTFLFWPEQGADPEVERQIAITWMNPAPSSLELEEVLDWRERTAREHYGTPQEVIGRVTAERIAFAGYIALEVRGQWSRRAESGETQQGSLLTRVAVCEGQDKAYLLDSWIHTPEAETYEYVVQLETILDTFRCE